MLLRFGVSNYASLRDEQELSLVAADDHPDLATGWVAREQLPVLPAVGIFGANASGKSNIIKALEFAQEAVRHSHQRWLPDQPIPRWPFRLDDESPVRPTECSFDLVVHDVRYAYGFALDDASVRQEWLYAYPEGKRRVYFEREDGSLHFGSHLTGHRKQIADMVRPNSLFLSAAAANNHPQLSPIYHWFSPPQMQSHQPRFASLLPSWLQEPLSDRVLELLLHADFGIVGSELVPEAPDLDGGGAGKPATRLELAHLARTETGRATLPWRWESTGTQAYLSLLLSVVTALDRGGLLIVDDLGSGLHPLLVAQLIRMFHEPARNRHRAQLVFNSHEVGLLGRHYGVRLARDQVFLTEKEQSGATRLFPLTEFRVRDQLDDVEGRYLKGRFGAVPFFDDDLLAVLSEPGDSS